MRWDEYFRKRSIKTLSGSLQQWLSEDLQMKGYASCTPKNG